MPALEKSRQKIRDKKKEQEKPPIVNVEKQHVHKVDLERYKKDGQLYCRECKEIMLDRDKLKKKPENTYVPERIELK